LRETPIYFITVPATPKKSGVQFSIGISSELRVLGDAGKHQIRDDLGSILDAARFTVLRPVYSDTMNLGTPYKYAGDTGTPYRVLDGVIVFIL
jgi:hypothetical protein